MDCPVLNIIHVIGKRWSVPLIEEIALGRFRGFNDFLRKSINMTPKMLSMQLKELEEHGIIEKPSNQYRKTNYKITEKGKGLHEIIIAIKKWSITLGSADEPCLDRSCAACEKFIRDDMGSV